MIGNDYLVTLHSSDFLGSRTPTTGASERQGKTRGARFIERSRCRRRLGEAIASALSSWAERFRLGASSLGDQSAALGKDAARYGTAALSQIYKETEQRPLISIAVALGVGVLIGMAASGRSR